MLLAAVTLCVRTVSAQGAAVPTATSVKAAPAAPAAPPTAAAPGASTAVAPTSTAAPAPPAQPQPGTELPSLPPSPLLDAPPSTGGPSDAGPSETDPRALTDFRPTLDAYGSWVEDPRYGLVWIPRRDIVGDGFAPYVTSGRWALDTHGEWVWVSDYPFGEIVFHYGRWAHLSGRGWVWVPGYRYAPAWVSWRVPTGSYAYVGWAPLPPDYGWFGGMSVSLWWGHPTPWVFCPSSYVFHRHVDHYVVRDRVLVTRLAANSTRYVAARPRLRVPARTLAGPRPAEARIPAEALPRERVRAVMPARRAAPALVAPRSPTRLPGGSVDRVPSRPSFAPSDLNRVRPERRTRTERPQGETRVERPKAPVFDRERVQPRVQRERAAPRIDFGRDADRVRAPRVRPIQPGNVQRLRRPK